MIQTRSFRKFFVVVSLKMFVDVPINFSFCSVLEDLVMMIKQRIPIRRTLIMKTIQTNYGAFAINLMVIGKLKLMEIIFRQCDSDLSIFLYF